MGGVCVGREVLHLVQKGSEQQVVARSIGQRETLCGFREFPFWGWNLT